MVAKRRSDFRIAKILLINGADRELKDKSGKTALKIAK
jgi:hypothetical protein